MVFDLLLPILKDVINNPANTIKKGEQNISHHQRYFTYEVYNGQTLVFVFKYSPLYQNKDKNSLKINGNEYADNSNSFIKFCSKLHKICEKRVATTYLESLNTMDFLNKFRQKTK